MPLVTVVLQAGKEAVKRILLFGSAISVRFYAGVF